MKKLFTLAALVSQFIHSHATDYNLRRDAIAAVLMGEARGEGTFGMLAIAEVIRNRGGDPFEQAIKPRQFSCLNNKTVSKLILKMSREQGWHEAQLIADKLIKAPAQLGDSVHGANHFERHGTKAFWAARLRPVATIGNHDFYLCK